MRFVVVTVFYGVLWTTVPAAQGDDPDWPCIQRKVPELSFGQIWNGPELAPNAADWAKDTDVAQLVMELAARRIPLAEAEHRIEDFSAMLAPEERYTQLSKLMQGLFDHMNRERSQVMSGIGRYAHAQREIAAALRQDASEVDKLRGQANANANEIAVRDEQLILKTRIFQERVQSLTFVCEVPTLIEQRLYALAKAISQTWEKR
ncbi:hypothetical protein [Rhizobium halophilum]|uniref:hypothetical protein n=1 Tax=Rhizobium halophilum TaxID=2846852 RepID=UPI001EFD38F8|nr:hypothetical protein [Rhizobium halophilum]MCF6370330.1 hypothetical protein [Rhizobium halophilum]